MSNSLDLFGAAEPRICGDCGCCKLSALTIDPAAPAGNCVFFRRMES